MPGKTQNSPVRDAAVRRMFQGKAVLSLTDNEQHNVAEQRAGGGVSAFNKTQFMLTNHLGGEKRD
jgi:hypothetical protein